MYDVIIIGKGPAGAQAGIYLGRAGFKTLILYKDGGSLEKADYVENYYGFGKPVEAKKLLQEGVGQARRFNVEFKEDQVVMLLPSEHSVSVQGLKGEYVASYVIIAAGMTRRSLNVPGLRDLEGKGISYCVTCDGFFFRNKKAAIIGYTDYAEHELNNLLMFTKDVYLLTNGNNPEFDVPGEIPVIDKQIGRIYGQDSVEGVEFKDGSKQQFDGIFIAYGTADASSFSLKSGIATEKGKIVVDSSKMTNIDRIYAAGDCINTYMQVATAVSDGALAARSVTERLKEDRKRSK
ncbi:MAG TPA: NAD(P)/FAD-dependent oxidoreductase [Clostridia bacterium]|jgi:thioredoxin reductase (NADPH)|nr:NAD(P)/FAD-dependent oxidoreductase [Clostridiaceae bacterium]HOF26155.1 NAD(P)/FAD-dependent oxidoreductase [Clostridia bacterium]HOM33948.1 NAD(P)/FAD-dependent oxidoreductase [Clostridia bacterium]HOR89474.1 NAD(P)/FAD-dependent oxidoreductase [Clostridia bacterium]HOT69784.1 NAD(P)/FAD-dependent oxidoreductase [Clostridia bacterium]